MNIDYVVPDNYGVFVLGYDLLHDEICGMACNEAFNYCQQIYLEFLNSEEYQDMELSEYSALVVYLYNQGYINWRS